MAQPLMLEQATPARGKLQLKFRNSSIILTLHEPITILTDGYVSSGEFVVVLLDGSGRIRPFQTDPALRASLSMYPVVGPDDVVLSGDQYREVMRSFSESQRALNTHPRPPAPNMGKLSTDGTFVSVEVDGRRTHFLIAEGRLPRVIADPAEAPDGSIVVRLEIPEMGESTFTVRKHDSVDAEKAIVMLRHVARGSLS